MTHQKQCVYGKASGGAIAQIRTEIGGVVAHVVGGGADGKICGRSGTCKNSMGMSRHN